MSFDSLVNVAKCPTCPNMVALGRLKPDKPKQCQSCQDKTQRLKKRFQAKMRYRQTHKKICIRCGGDVNVIKGVRKEICLDCQELIRLRYQSQKCIYCDSPLVMPNQKFCSHKCQMKTLYIVNGRKN